MKKSNQSVSVTVNVDVAAIMRAIAALLAYLFT